MSIDDKEIWAYYDKNRGSFRQPEQVKASQILIKADPGWDEAKKAAARKKIDEIRAKLKAGQDFESLARTYSEDPSGPKGGDLGYIRTGQVLKPFEEALFALKPGEVSDVVETSLGYHIIKASDRKPETTIPFEKVKDQLRTALKQEKGQQEANAYIAKVREKAKVEISCPRRNKTVSSGPPLTGRKSSCLTDPPPLSKGRGFSFPPPPYLFTDYSSACDHRATLRG